MDAYDSDVLIYAATADHPLGIPVRAHLDRARGVGSTLLLPELLAEPTRLGRAREVDELILLLSRLDLHPCDEATARVSVGLAAAYGLRAADAVHLATAVSVGAARFITNNRKDFTDRIREIDITHPEDLPPPPS